MDGIHDLGGKMGFGAIEREPDEPVFHARWEAAVFTMTRAARAAGAVQNTDQFRHAVERIHPAAYLTHGYYGRWLGALENLLTEADVISSEVLHARVVERGGDPGALVAARPDTSFGPFAPGLEEHAHRPLETPGGFVPGQRVRTTMNPTTGHTRLPAYARNRCGVITAAHGGWVFPDSNAHGAGEQPTHLYTVEFSGAELWGPLAEPGITVSLDLFEPYLQPVDHTDPDRAAT